MNKTVCGMDVHVLASKLTNKNDDYFANQCTFLAVNIISEHNQCTSTTMKDQHTMTHEQN